MEVVDKRKYIVQQTSAFEERKSQTIFTTTIYLLCFKLVKINALSDRMLLETTMSLGLGHFLLLQEQNKMAILFLVSLQTQTPCSLTCKCEVG